MSVDDAKYYEWKKYALVLLPKKGDLHDLDN